MSFLPENYEAPKGNNKYWNKWEKGANKFRALGAAITGWEYWVDEDGKRKPIRVTKLSEVPSEYRKGDRETDAKHFWAFPVWNYQAELVQILSFTQATIQNYIKDFVDNADWGDPTTFDITVNRKGDGFDTEYTVTPSPKKDLPAEVTKAFKAENINMQALFAGEDPFGEPAEAPKDSMDIDIDEALGLKE